MLSLTESGNTSGGCSTMEICRRSAAIRYSRISMPSISTLPVLGSKKRGNMPSRVDLPAPVGPTTATLVPGSILRSTLLRTGICG